MSISTTLSSFEWQRAQDQPARHARRAELRGRRARRAARVRVGGVRRQRGDGRRGLHQPPVGAGRRAGHRADAVREHARPRARRLLPHARAAQGGVRPARRRDRDPDRLRARARGRDRPGRHEGASARTPPSAARWSEIPIPDAQAELRAGVPREADGRGLRGLRRADGALPRRARRSPTRRSSTRSRRAPTTARSSPSCAAWPRATSAPRACSTRSSRTCPRRSSTAR